MEQLSIIPTPTLSNIITEDEVYKFTLGNVNVSLANAIRRTILSDIPTLAFYTENNKENQCKIEINTSRMHNELIKHRLSCIPINMKELDILPNNYVLELDVKNDGENTIIVTTEDFKIRNKENGNYLTKDETRKIFPPNQKTNMYIDFVRLRAKISDTIPGEHIKLSSEFSVHTAKDNSTYNVVSKCTYSNTPDMIKINEIWDNEEQKLRSEQMTTDDIEFQKKNFYLLDAERHYVSDSFDFVIQSVGVYENIEIVKKACKVLEERLNEIVHSIDSNIVPINISETTMDNCYDIILENEDYTLGKVIEFVLYESHYVREKTLSFCGFKIFHPHNTSGTLRLAFTAPVDKGMIGQYLRTTCNQARDVFVKINNMF